MNINAGININEWEYFEVDSKIFDLETIYRALYCLLDKAYFMLKSKDNGNIIVYVKNKTDNAKEVIEELNNELIKFKELARRENATKDLEKAIMTDILFPTSVNKDNTDIKDIDFEKLEKELESELRTGDSSIPLNK